MVGEWRGEGERSEGEGIDEWNGGMNVRGRTAGDGDKNVESWKRRGWIGWLGSVRWERMVWEKGGGGMLGK